MLQVLVSGLKKLDLPNFYFPSRSAGCHFIKNITVMTSLTLTLILYDFYKFNYNLGNILNYVQLLRFRNGMKDENPPASAPSGPPSLKLL